MRAHIAIIDPAARIPELESFNNIGMLTTARLSFHLPCLFGGSSLYEMDLDSIQGAIILGSGASVYDDDKWQKPLKKWCQSAMDKRIPLFGFCYGHQLLAHILGGKIGFVSKDQKKLVGTRKVHFKNTNNSLTTIKEGTFIVSHREHVEELGKECEIFAYSTDIAIDGFNHVEKPVWGMQAHPEAGRQFIINQNLPVDDKQENFDSGQKLICDFFKFIEAKS